MNKLIIQRPEYFDIDRIFDCGQCFRFNRNERGEWEGVALGRKLTFGQNEKEITVTGAADCDYGIISEYLDLSSDYSLMTEDIISRVGDSGFMIKAIKLGKGIRILRQDRWETVCSFIISQNNNIPRIKKLIETLCTECGEKIDGGYLFPTPESVCALGEERLAELKTGYRAPFIYRAAKDVAEGKTDLNSDFPSTDSLMKFLLGFHGIGPKVANCISLFGYHRLDSFPVDTWIKKALKDHFPNHSPADFGPYGGLAQQYMFYGQTHG